MTQKKLTMSFPVEDTINGVPVGHPRFMLHCRVSADGRRIEWDMSCSLPARRRTYNRFERYFGQVAKKLALSPELGETLQDIATKRGRLIASLTANTQAAGITEAVETWINRSTKKNYFDRLKQIEEDLPFPMTDAEVEKRKATDPSIEHTSIESFERDLEKLNEQRDQLIEACRSDESSVRLALHQYLQDAGLHLNESDQEAMLCELMLDGDRCGEFFQLEPLDQAHDLLQETKAASIDTERIFISMDVVLEALHPKNQGKAVIRGYSYACLPPKEGELRAAGDQWEYLEYNVDKGVIGAQYGDYWIHCIVDRNMLIGLLDSWQKYQQSDIPRLVLEALNAPPSSEET